VLTAKGNLSTKVNPGRTYKRRLKIERIVRLTAAGYTDDEIAIALRIHKAYVSMLRRTPEYIAIRTEVHTGIISEEDRFLREDLANMRAELREMVPAALIAIRDTIYDKSNPKLRFEAAKEIMDREGSIIKVSKTEVKLPTVQDFSKHDLIAEDLLGALQAATSTAITDSLDEFVKTSVDAVAQERLHKNLDLNTLDVKSAVVQ